MSEHSDTGDKSVVESSCSGSNKLTRALYMLLFAFIWGLAEVVLGGVAILQLILMVINNESNAQLKKFGASLSDYLRQIGLFVTFNSEEKPFPFSDWPA